jgi:hypothetical protein
MSKRQQGDKILPGLQGEAPQIQGSEVKSSGRVFFALAKSVIDLIDDELQVSKAHKCAGKKVDMRKRALRLASGAYNKVSKINGQIALGETCGAKQLFNLPCINL